MPQRLDVKCQMSCFKLNFSLYTFFAARIKCKGVLGHIGIFNIIFRIKANEQREKKKEREL